MPWPQGKPATDLLTRQLDNLAPPPSSITIKEATQSAQFIPARAFCGSIAMAPSNCFFASYLAAQCLPTWHQSRCGSLLTPAKIEALPCSGVLPFPRPLLQRTAERASGASGRVRIRDSPSEPIASQRELTATRTYNFPDDPKDGAIAQVSMAVPSPWLVESIIVA